MNTTPRTESVVIIILPKWLLNSTKSILNYQKCALLLRVPICRIEEILYNKYRFLPLMEWLTLIIMATGGKKKLPVLNIENMVVLDLKYIQTGNTFNFSNHQQKFSHLHFYEMTFITKQSSSVEYAPFSFAFWVQNMPVYYCEWYELWGWSSKTSGRHRWFRALK